MPCNVIPYVSARITGRELKELVLEKVQPHWQKLTFGYLLNPEIFTLCLVKNMVNLERDFSDSCATYDQCLTKTGKTSSARFSYGKNIKVVLMLENEVYDTITAHIDDAQAQLEEDNSRGTLASSHYSEDIQNDNPVSSANTPVRASALHTSTA
ncbi:hypothetical protein FRC12_024645 [Ceratobasidium sp. 428]|nr:hypothetical protein FRC12_024645 [Ceratobasidium sp. 428]